MATHSSTLAWKIPWTEEPGRLQSMGSQRVGHDWATSLSQGWDSYMTTPQKIAEKWSQRLDQNLCQTALEPHIFSRLIYNYRSHKFFGYLGHLTSTLFTKLGKDIPFRLVWPYSPRASGGASFHHSTCTGQVWHKMPKRKGKGCQGITLLSIRYRDCL